MCQDTMVVMATDSECWRITNLIGRSGSGGMGRDCGGKGKKWATFSAWAINVGPS